MCIKLKKLSKYCCKHKKSTSHFTLNPVDFLKEYLMKNTENMIFVPLDFKILGGGYL